MVGSTYIHIRRNGRRTLLNVAQVASIYTSDIEIASKAGQIEYGHRYPVEQGTIYTIQLMLTSRREMEFIYAKADERDEVYDQIVAALAPAVTIENLAPFVPEIPATEAWSKFRKPLFPNEIFATEEEYDRALDRVVADLKSGKNRPRPPEPPTATPPTPKPPSKPRTPRQ
jgi:hypothetical protein